MKQCVPFISVLCPNDGKGNFTPCCSCIILHLRDDTPEAIAQPFSSAEDALVKRRANHGLEFVQTTL